MKISRSQFQDILALADRIQQDRHVDGDLENFAKFSEEFKKYLLKRTENDVIIEQLNGLPRIEYKEFQPSLMEYLRINGLSYLWKQKDKRREILKKVTQIASIYSSVYLLILQDSTS